MLICQIPDREHDQTQPEPRKQIRGEDTQQIANSRSQAPSQLEENRRPDGRGEQYARYEYPIRDVQYSRKRRDHDAHTGDVAPDDDRPGSPALESSLGPVQLLFSQADDAAVTSDEWPSVSSRDREVTSAPEHRACDHGHVGKRIRDRPGRRQVAAISDGCVTRRGQWHPQLFEEDHEEQAPGLGVEDKEADSARQRPQPRWFLQPPRKDAREMGGHEQHFVRPNPMPSRGLYVGFGAYPCSRRRDERLGLRPSQLGAKDSFKMTRVAARGGLGVNPMPGERVHRGRMFLRMATRDDALEVIEVGREVQREAMADDRSVQLDPDGGHLLAIRPDAREAGASGLGSDAELTNVVDDRPLELLQVLRNRDLKMREIENRVADQLAGTVVGRLSASVGPDDIDRSPVPFGLVPQQVVRARGPAHREDVRVLEQQ